MEQVSGDHTGLAAAAAAEPLYILANFSFTFLAVRQIAWKEPV